MSFNIMKLIETSYSNDEDTSYWIEYETEKGLGYEFIKEKFINGLEMSKEEFIAFLMKEKNMNKDDVIQYIINKPMVTECSDYLRTIIENCRQSENDMWFVEYGDEEFLNNMHHIRNFVMKLENEINKLGLESVVRMYEDDCYVTVYGEVITRFMF